MASKRAERQFAEAEKAMAEGDGKPKPEHMTRNWLKKTGGEPVQRPDGSWTTEEFPLQDKS